MTSRQADPFRALGARFLTGLAVPPFALPGAVKCTPGDAELFFPKPRTDEHDAQVWAFCRPCPLREACLAWGNEHSPTAGFYGGLSPSARRKRLRAEARAAA